MAEIGNYRELAEKLASRPYDVEVINDQTTDGLPIYMAKTPELRGCMAQGRTIDEAIANLAEARIDYIESLLDDDLPVPDPVQYGVTVNKIPQMRGVFMILAQPGDIDDVLDDVIEPSYRESRYRASLRTSA